MTEHMVAMRCRGCKRTCGIGPVSRRLYCNDFCVEFPAAQDEARDHLVTAVWRKTGQTMESLSRFGVSRQRIAQIVSQP